jgi:hypothetical protein
VYVQTATHDTYNGYASACIHELHKVYLETATHERYNGYAWAPSKDCKSCTYRPPAMKGTIAMHEHPYEVHNVYIETAIHDRYNGYAWASIRIAQYVHRYRHQ